MKRIISILLTVILFSSVVYAEEKTHVVKKGETIESIAKTFGITTESLIEANPTLKQYMYAGMTLKIPAATAQPTAQTATATEAIPSAIAEPATTTESATAQTAKTMPTEYIHWGLAYTAGLDELDAGFYGFKIDRITPMGWNANARILTNFGIKGTKFKDSNTWWAVGANYCPIASESAFLYFPILLNALNYTEITYDEYLKEEKKAKLGIGLSVEPSVMLRLGGFNLTAGLSIYWFHHVKDVDTALALGIVF